MASLKLSRPEAAEHAPCHIRYISLVPEGDVVVTLTRQLSETLALLKDVPEAVGNTRHAPYTWSVKEVVGHLADCERVFGYRALRIARNDRTPLAGFEENDYVRYANFDASSLKNLVAEFEAVRRSSLAFFGNLSEEAWSRIGVANDTPVSVRAAAYIMAGHELHHVGILRKRLAGKS
jgi:hypothetical protein